MNTPFPQNSTVESLRDLPEGFRWGAATAAYQVEGAVDVGGRGPSTWDTFSHTPGRTLNGDTGDIAADHYHRFAEDIAAMADLGLDAYRFSIAWPRIVPGADQKVNQQGLDHYDRVVDVLLEHNIEPMVTAFHWDLPQWVEDRGGWYHRDSADLFADYAKVVAERLGDRVPRWLTLNEPWTVIGQGYSRGLHAPGYRDYASAGTALHHLMLAHGRGREVMKETLPSTAEVGITLCMAIAMPWSDSQADVSAAKLLDGEQNRVYLDPLFKGEYPADMEGLFPTLFDANVVQDGDLEKISAPLDYIGVNHYLRHYVKADATVPVLGAQQILPVGPVTSAGIAARADGLGECLLRVRNEYRDLPMMVTEVGSSHHDYVAPDGRVRDGERISYLSTAVEAIAKACRNGADVRGMYVWSLLDNLEWELGYSVRFGLFHVDYGSQTRTPKDSAFWYRDLIQHAKASH